MKMFWSKRVCLLFYCLKSGNHLMLDKWIFIKTFLTWSKKKLWKKKKGGGQRTKHLTNDLKSRPDLLETCFYYFPKFWWKGLGEKKTNKQTTDQNNGDVYVSSDNVRLRLEHSCWSNGDKIHALRPFSARTWTTFLFCGGTQARNAVHTSAKAVWSWKQKRNSESNILFSRFLWSVFIPPIYWWITV